MCPLHILLFFLFFFSDRPVGNDLIFPPPIVIQRKVFLNPQQALPPQYLLLPQHPINRLPDIVPWYLVAAHLLTYIPELTGAVHDHNAALDDTLALQISLDPFLGLPLPHSLHALVKLERVVSAKLLARNPPVSQCLPEVQTLVKVYLGGRHVLGGELAEAEAGVIGALLGRGHLLYGCDELYRGVVAEKGR